jgi:cyanophycinase
MPRVLIPIGGSEKRSTDSEIFREMVELAGGADARIVVVPTASEEPGERARDYVELFSSFNPKSVQTLHIGERQDAAAEHLQTLIAETTLFMFGGGDQLRLSSLIGGTPLHRALVKRYRSGECVVAGTSAGAAVIPETMIFQNNQFQPFRKGGLEMSDPLVFRGFA